VRSLETVEQALEKAHADAARILPMRRQQLQLRLRAVGEPERQALKADIEERELHEHIIRSAISEPRIRIDGVGLVVLASAAPPEPEA
jgi:hypothetical protein